MTYDKQAPSAKTRFDGHDLREMFSSATRLFECNVEIINALNVFPVPDGDTGTNMFLTMREVTRRAESVPSDSADEVIAAMAQGALFEARGNSGVILCQFFKGMALKLEGEQSFGPAELASALRCASDHAYVAVGEPVEGTMLTVISSVADVAQKSADSGGTLQEMIGAVCHAAIEAVALTPTMLPVLREAGVVDAGGQGLAVILEGIRQYVSGEEMELREIAPPEPVGVEAGAGTVSSQFLEAVDEELYGYCTQFLIRGQGLSQEAVRREMTSLAESAVVVGDAAMLKVHVHAHDPGPVISFATSLGTLAQVKIESMDEQHREYSLARRQEAASGPAAPGVAAASVVAVAWGQGLETVFADLGAVRVLRAGDTMNPSIQEILDAVESAPGDDVILLPNNRNIVPAAQKAVELSKKSLRVVPSTTIPQGIAAMLAFSPEKSLDGSVSEMERSLLSVRTGEVCHAVRPAQLNGVSVREGQIIGMLERELVAAGDESTEVLVSILKAADVSNGDLVTLYWGGPLTGEDADIARQRVEDAFPGAEVEVVTGGQPHYNYIVSIE